MGLFVKEESTRWKSYLLLHLHLEWSLGAFKNCCIFNEKPSWEPFKNLSWTKQIPLNELFYSRWPHSNKFNRGKGGNDSNRKREMYLPDKYCSFQLRRLKLLDPLEVKCSSVLLCSATMFHFSSCSTRVSPNFYCCCAAVESSLDCCKPSFSKHCVKTNCTKSWQLVAHRDSGESSRSQNKTGSAVAPFPFCLKDRKMGRSL